MKRTWFGATGAARLRTALVCGAAHWAVLLAIQVGNYFGYLLPAGAPSWRSASYLLTIPFIQSQNAAVAALVALLSFGLGAVPALRWGSIAVLALFNAYSLADQVFYKVFLDHIRPTGFEGGAGLNLSLFTGSFLRELDGWFWLALVVAAAGIVWCCLSLRQPGNWPWRLPVAGAAVFALSGLPALGSQSYFHLNEHPAVILALDYSARSLTTVLARQDDGTARAPLPVSAASSSEPAPATEPPVERDPRLTALRAASRSAHRPMNVVLVVMESVGAENLLRDNGLPSAIITPRIARLAQHAALFRDIYTPFPGTTRSLVSLHTGGRYVTSGNTLELRHWYEGPTLARLFNSGGYTTGLFSSERLDGEASDAFLQQVGYQKLYDFAQDLPAHRPETMIHSWGAREEHTLDLMKTWLRQARRGSKPFYLEYMTVATHHPYGAPAGFATPITGDDSESQYLKALHYTDHAIGELVAFLEAEGLASNTIVAITGDHGEAFGYPHAGNLLHKLHIYEENVREFFLLSDPRFPAGMILSDRVGANGDILPTLLAQAGLPEARVPGRDLFAPEFDSRPVFFHTAAYPEKWGLRDGKWKFLAEIRSGKAQLYNLETDPDEAENLAGGRSEQVARYRRLCHDWYLRTNQEYVVRLRDYRPNVLDTSLKAMLTNGPKMLAVGSYDATSTFLFERSQFRPSERPITWTKWVNTESVPARYEWISPNGESLPQDVTIDKDWAVSYVTFPGSAPMQEGRWTLRLWFGGKAALSTEFSVGDKSDRPPEPHDPRAIAHMRN